MDPVNEFIETLPPKRAAKIDDYVEEYLNDRPASAPPPEFPVSSQIDGELRELRIRFGNTRYRVLYQRSDNLVVLLHAIEKNTGAIADSDKRGWRCSGWLTSSDGWTRAAGCRRGRRVKMRRLAAEEEVDVFIKIDKLVSR